MYLDIILVVYVLFGIFMGVRRGIRSEIMAFGSALVGVGIVYLISPTLSDYFLQQEGVTFLESRIFAFLVGMGIIFLFMIVPPTIYSLIRSESPSLPGRVLGSLFGGLKNILIASLIAGLIQYVPNLNNGFQGGLFATSYEKTLSEPVEANMGENHIIFSGKDIVENPKKMKQLKETEEFQSIIKHPKVQEIANDPEVIEAAKNRNFSALAENPKVNELLKDKEFRKELQTKLRKAMKKVNQSKNDNSPSN